MRLVYVPLRNSRHRRARKFPDDFSHSYIHLLGTLWAKTQTVLPYRSLHDRDAEAAHHISSNGFAIPFFPMRNAPVNFARSLGDDALNSSSDGFGALSQSFLRFS